MTVKPETTLFERNETATTNDQVIQRVDIQELARLHDSPGDSYVIGAGRRVAGWVVMYQDDRRRHALDGGLEQLGHPSGCLVVLLGASPADAMQYAGRMLSQQAGNGSALVYAHGLACLAGEFAERKIDLDDLRPYIQAYLSGAEKGKEREEQKQESRSGEILKSLLSALTAWEQAEAGEGAASSALDTCQWNGFLKLMPP